MPRRERAGPLFEANDQRWPDVSRVLAHQPWPALEPFVDAEQAAETLARLQRFVELLLQWNRNVSNLISQNDEKRIVAAHLAPSIEPAAWIRSHDLNAWVDFGSGGGFPAIPLALCGVGRAWDLVESRRTKTLFLRRAVEQLSLGGTSILAGRLEDLVLNATSATGNSAAHPGAGGRAGAASDGFSGADSASIGAVGAPGEARGVEPDSAGGAAAAAEGGSIEAGAGSPPIAGGARAGAAGGPSPGAAAQLHSLRAPFDGFTSRATMALGPTLRLARPIVRAGGAAFLWKGSRLDEEIAEAREDLAGWREVERRPLANGQTTVIKLLRTGE